MRTTRNGAAVLLTLFGGLLLAVPAAAQRQPGPPMPTSRLFVVTPNGGKAGTSLEVVITGTDMEEPQSLLFSHPGIKG